MAHACLLALACFAHASTARADVASADAAGTETETTETEPTAFVDEVTVTATRSERALRDTPAQVDYIDALEIERRGYTGVDDLVRYLPGVYVDGDPTRLGTSGFNIRGIGGNRVLTEIDGVPTAEQFDFGPFSVHQFALDVDALESVEIVRSAASALYGSDALGGVVALTTRSPRSYLGDEPSYFALRLGHDGRADESSVAGTVALGADRWQGSLLVTRRDGGALDNQGTVDTDDFTRTRPNPIDRTQDSLLAQLAFTPTDSMSWRGVVEHFESSAETEILSSIAPGSPAASAVLDADGLDDQERTRVSLSHQRTQSVAVFDSLLARAFVQSSDTEQRTVEVREPAQGPALRDGLLTFEQESMGVEGEMRKALGSRTLLTYGATYQRDAFDQLRDRSEIVVATGAPVPTSLAFPSKYFPRTDVEESGAFAQAELSLWGGRLALVPGVRYDRFDLDADQDDTVFLSGNPGTPTPVDTTEDAVSPKLGVVGRLSDSVSVFVNLARGFRAPPMSDVNNGFTNQAGGYRTLPNPDLRPETSDHVELGVRGSRGRFSFSAVAFETRYDDFIELVSLGFDPVSFLVEFQPRNVEDVEISGVELTAELGLGRGFTLRGSYADIEGSNESTGEPLESVAPPQLVAGLRYLASGGRWGAELVGTATAAKDADDLPSDSTQFELPSSEVLDLSAWWQIHPRLNLQVSAWNLTDETYWRWPFVRGQSQESPTITRYTSPGRSVGAQIRYTF